MTREELLNLKENTLITAEINGTNRNGEPIHKLRVFKLHKNAYNIKETTIFLNGMDWSYSDLRLTKESDIIELITQEIARNNAEIKRLFNLFEEVKGASND